MFGYPAQISLIPTTVALIRFIEEHGPSASSGLYPYWYLGTTPLRYLIGPVLPGVCLALHRIFSSLSLFEIMFGLIGVSWVVGGIGVYCLVKTLNNTEQNTEKHRMAVLAALFYLLGPIVPFLFRFSDGLYLIAFSLLPITFLMYLKLLKKWAGRTAIFSVIMISFLILLDSLIIPTLLLGMAAIFLAQVGWKKAEEKLKQSFLIFTFSFLISTIWYTPGYWLTLLGAPSLAGKGLLGVVGDLGKLLPTTLAIVAAIFFSRVFKKREPLRDFCFYWLFVFGFLTLIRFLSDPDFWLDWSAYGTELQMGIGIALGVFFEDRRQRTEDGLQKAEDRRRITESQSSVFSLQNLFSVFCFPSSMLFALYLLIFVFITNKYVLGTFQTDITQTVEYRIGRQLSQIVKPSETVLLSGTTAFWLNAFFDIPQVRGGRDQVSVHPTWRQAVWEIREGESPQKSLEWLKKLGVDYLVVHTPESEEFYHDFSNPEKFETAKSLRKVYEDRGDVIYKVMVVVK